MSSQWFLPDLLGVVYLIAFISFWVQSSGLLGEKGIAPAGTFFQRAGEILGPGGFWQLPSVLLVGCGRCRLAEVWAAGGVVVSVLLITGFAPLACLIFLWAVYLSLTVAGQVFYQFQWDILLLETDSSPFFWRP